MEDEPPRKRGRPITRQDWDASQKQIHLSTSTFERWRELKTALALASDDAVASYLLDFLALHYVVMNALPPYRRNRTPSLVMNRPRHLSRPITSKLHSAAMLMDTRSKTILQGIWLDRIKYIMFINIYVISPARSPFPLACSTPMQYNNEGSTPCQQW